MLAGFSTITFQTSKIDAVLCERERMMRWAAPRDGAQVLARSVHLHPGYHTPRRVREFVRRHTAHASCAGGKTWQCPCAGREPCTRRFAIQAMRHPSASRHAQCCRKVEDDPAKLYELIACAHELVVLQQQLSRQTRLPSQSVDSCVGAAGSVRV